jgi:hypothetical protein
MKRLAATGDSKSNESENRGVEPQKNELFWKPANWLPVILLMPGLLWGGCRGGFDGLETRPLLLRNNPEFTISVAK